MYDAERKYIDWNKTGKNLKLLRCDNILLRKYVCRALRTASNDCDGVDCDNCRFDMDNSISQAELAKVFNVSENMVANWENNRSTPSLEDLIFYSQICGISLEDIIVFRK